MFYSYFLGILLCVAGSATAFYDSYSDVVELTPNNFDRLVSSGDEVWLVEFYAPWCGHCKNLIPEYQKTARALRGIVKVGAMDADKHKSFTHQFGVTGFPTIKIFTGKKHTPYKGHRTAESFVDAALKAAKDKAYENLGKRASDYSSDKRVIPEVYGHNLPWKAKQNTPAPTTRSVATQSDQTETCSIQGLSDIFQLKQTMTSKIVPRQTTTKLKKQITTTKIVPKPTKAENTPTSTLIKQTSTVKILDKFKELQNHLFRGGISSNEKPKIIRALMKLKSVLRGEGIVNAPIVRTSELRKGYQKEGERSGLVRSNILYQALHG